jgi:uncharacterized protein
MKYLVIVLVIVVVIWLARSATRRANVGRSSRAPTRPEEIEDMVTCTRCGVHLPRSEALPGLGGSFCGEAHRAEHERESRTP